MNENLLKNPVLDWDAQPPLAYHLPTIVEQPRAWRYVYVPGAGLLATSLHKDDGFRLEGGSRTYQAGYAQAVTLKAGVRYSAHLVFTPEIYVDGVLNDQHSVRVFIKCGSAQSDDRWVTMSDHMKPQSLEYEFSPAEDGVFDFTMWVHNKWPLRNVVVTMHTITLAQVSEPEEEPEPEEPPPPPPPDDELPGDPVQLAVLYIQHDAQIAALEGQITVLRGKQREIMAKALAAG